MTCDDGNAPMILDFHELDAILLDRGVALDVAVNYQGESHQFEVCPERSSMASLLNYAIIAIARIPGMDSTLGGFDRLQPVARATYNANDRQLNINIDQ